MKTSTGYVPSPAGSAPSIGIVMEHLSFCAEKGSYARYESLNSAVSAAAGAAMHSRTATAIAAAARTGPSTLTSLVEKMASILRLTARISVGQVGEKSDTGHRHA